MLPHMQVDRGAVKFILVGAQVMCRGLTSKGAKMDDVKENSPVAIMVDGKQSAIGVGLTLLSAQDMFRFFFYYYFNLLFLLLFFQKKIIERIKILVLE